MDTTALSRVTERISGYRALVTDIQTKLTAIPAMSPENGGTGEAEKAAYIKQLLEELSFDSIEQIDAPDDRVPSGIRPSIIARVKGKSSGRTIWIMSHSDVVPAGDREQWDTDPFTVTEKDGKLFGRGCEDDQQGFVSSYLAVKALQEEAVIPEYDVGLAVVADEESGSKHGIQYVLQNRPGLFKKDDIIIIPDAGDDKGVTIEVAEKSILWMKFTTKGKQTHGSTPELGVNAHKAAANLLVKLEELYGMYDKNDPLYDPPISTFEPTKKELNVDNVNTIPGSDVFYADCRIHPDYSLVEVKKTVRGWADEIEKKFGVQISISHPQEEPAPPSTPVDAPVVGALKKAVRDLRNGEAQTIGIGGGTVAAYFREAGLPAVCWCTLDDTLHAPNEYCVIDYVLDDAKVFAHIFMQS